MNTEVHIVEKRRLIDVEELIRVKNKRLQRCLPRFVINYLKRVLHQDEVNYVLQNYSGTGLEFVGGILQHFNITYMLEGAEKLNSNERYLLVSNHPLGGLDGVVLLDAIGKTVGDVKFVVNDLLLFLDPLAPIFLPINKHGNQSSNVVQQLKEGLASDSQILYFPAGLCSRKINGEIVDLPWKRSFIKFATEHQRHIVPLFFEGRNSNFFYNLANFRKCLGLKFNLEMLYLTDELFRKRNAHFKVKVGAPIPYQTFTKEKSAVEWAKFVRDETYALDK
ncbi:MAG: 1-acyl-sn-glycerol-3-phosphate acyltransferase [Bacteroidales bacterium]